jgi:DNA-binding NarL/FixJ family response regulator
MSTSISSVLLNASSVAANPSANASPAPPAAKPQPAANVAADTVQLSEAQQVYQLYNQGQRVSQIASNLSLTQAAVNGYLNLNTNG